MKSDDESKKMDVENIFHMNGGEGEDSYAKNSSLQRKGMEMAKHITLNAVASYYSSTLVKTMTIADLGCSSGPNSLSVMTDMVKAIHVKCRQTGRRLPEFQLLLNDLPSNDFNSVFQGLSCFYENLKQETGEKDCCCFVVGVPGSFYGRLFPSNTVDFVHSSFSLHWLSQVPAELSNSDSECKNTGKIYISKNSPIGVTQAYLSQFKRDFSCFLNCRAKEMVLGGRMVLQFLYRRGQDPSDPDSTVLWELLARAMGYMVREGYIDANKLDNFHVPFYVPSREEFVTELRKDGSFKLEVMEMMEIPRNSDNGIDNGRLVAMSVRAILQPMIERHFGGGIIEPLFEKYAGLLNAKFAEGESKETALIIVVKRC